MVSLAAPIPPRLLFRELMKHGPHVLPNALMSDEGFVAFCESEGPVAGLRVRTRELWWSPGQ